MAESTIKLYEGFIAIPEKNMVIDNFATYIGSISPWKTITKFQYIKNQLNLSIKVDLSQGLLDMDPINSADLNYVSIYNSTDDMTFYYFVMSKTWKGVSTIELQLQMDVLNTFKWNEHYIVNKKTLVTREHKDRLSIKEVDYEHSRVTFVRNVHLASEGINAPVYCDDTEDSRETIIDKVDVSWSLYYRTINAFNPDDPESFKENNPVECFLVPSEPVECLYNHATGEILREDIPANKYWVFFSPYNYPVVTFNVDGKKYTPRIVTEQWRSDLVIGVTGIALLNTGSQLEVYWINAGTGYAMNIPRWTKIFSNATSVKIENPPSTLSAYQVDSLPSNTTIMDDKVYQSVYVNVSYSFGADTSGVVLGEEVIDRTDSRNIKIIKLPYAPTSFDINNVNQINFGSSWTYSVGDRMLKLLNDSQRFVNEFISNTNNPLGNMVLTTALPNVDNTRDDIYESKIFHSDYFRPKFVYDSFTLTFAYERLDTNLFIQAYDNYSGQFPIKFVASRNIVSKFMFMFPQYLTRYGEQDYGNIVPVARNNEEVLYTSQYINYLRTGYNYDLKSKQRSQAAGGIGLTISTLGTMLGIVGGVASGNYAMAGLSAVAGGLSIANQSISYAKSVAEADSNISRKLEEAQKQSVSVHNADDIDLLDEYTGNRAKLIWYVVSPVMEQALMDMFYYSGYTTQEQKVPNINTRYWFNYLQCNLVITGNSNLSDEIMNKITEKFKEGVTFFHDHTNVYNFEQTKENWELSILGGI